MTDNTDTTNEATSVVTVRLQPALLAEVQRRADELDRSVSWFVRNALQVQLESLAARESGSIAGPLVDWSSTDERGSCGFTYETTVTYALPAAEPDFAAYDIRDAIVRTVSAAGARDICTRTLSLAPMRMDERPQGSNPGHPILAQPGYVMAGDQIIAGDLSPSLG